MDPGRARLWKILAFVAFVALLLFVNHSRREGSFMNADLLEKMESPYNTIFVYQTKDGRRHMAFGYRRHRYFEAVHKPGHPLDLELPYTRLLTVGIAYAPELNSILSIGMGSGATSTYLLRTLPQARITEVELDPDVVVLARKYFEYTDSPRRTLFVEDGRRFLMTSHESYDLVLLDAYRGAFVPFHLLTEEFYAQLKQHLAPGGVVVENISTEALLADSTLATLQHDFQQVECFRVGDDNLIAVAYDGPRRADDELMQHAKELDAQYHLPYSLAAMLHGRTEASVKPGVKPLTDDFAPVDTLNAIERHDQKEK
jgi:spermidine synthase